MYRQIKWNILVLIFIYRGAYFVDLSLFFFVLPRFNAPGNVLTASGWRGELKDCADFEFASRN